jgi:integrase
MGVKVREKIKSSGDWWVFINYGGRRKSKHVGSEKAALRVKEIIEAKLKLGQSIDADNKAAMNTPSVPTLDSYFERYKNTLAGSVRESTLDCYEGRYKHQIKDELGSLRLDKITRERVEEFASSLVGKGLSKDTIRLTLATLRKILNKAVRSRLITENPATRLGEFYRQAPTRHKEIEPLTEVEVIKFLEAVRQYSQQHFALFLCAIHTGLRSGELAGLQWGDLDENGKFLVVRRGIVRGKVNPTKSGKVRKVDVSDALMSALLELRRKRKEALLADGRNELPATIWIFENENGGFQDMKNLKNRHFHKCLEKAGLRRIRFHDLRHTFASLLIQNREPLAYVKEQLGHSSIKITVDVYGHLVPGANRQAVNRLPSLDGFQAAERNLKEGS